MEHVWSGAGPGSALGRADLHAHTWWSDGAQSPEDLVRAAAGRVDVLAVTDHDGIGGAVRAREFARDHPALGVEIVVGEEVSTLNGHLLALYLEEAVPPGLPAGRTIDLIHAQGGLAIPAHPFHPIRYRGSRNAEWMLAVTGGSDAHDVAYLGSAVTRFEGRGAAALRRALLERRTRAHLEWTWGLGNVPRHFGVKLLSFGRWLNLSRRAVAASRRIALNPRQAGAAASAGVAGVEGASG